jgi:transposase
LSDDFRWFLGIDWGSEKHRACLLDGTGKIVEEKWLSHTGSGLCDLVDWLRETSHAPGELAVAIETPHGALVETLVEHGFSVFSINPKQLDRFRDRYSPAGAKDDQRDALVLADSVRTDRHCFHAVRLDEPRLIRLRELSRLQDSIAEDQTHAANQLWEQLHRYFPAVLEVSGSADEPWLWDLLQMAPSPAEAAKLSTSKIARLLQKHRIRRVDAVHLQSILRSTPLTLAPGAAEAAREHVLFLLPQLRLLHQQRTEVAKRAEAVLEELAVADDSADPQEHRDVTILRSLPGVGRQSPPRCSARLPKRSRIEITTPCAAWPARLPLLARVARKKWW